jgi:aminomethyltransferase
VTETATKKTALYDEHVKLGAKMVPFAGWLMPVQYNSIVEEHQAVRKNIGTFDISHMGQFIVAGNGAGSWLNTMLTNNIAKLEVGQGQYTFLLNEKGGIIDDLITYRIGDAKFLLVVNASRSDEDLDWLKKHARGDVKIESRSANFGGVAIQGPRLSELFVNLPDRNHIVDLEIDGMPITIARTGYTGEDGIEVFFRNSDAAKFWNTVLEKGKNLGLKPCGLGARDTLRLEMCYPLNGSDLAPERNPIEDSVFENGERIGEVTSGTLSPSLNWGVGMAYVSAPHAKIGTQIDIEIRGQKFPATIEKKPLYKKS